MEIREQQAKLGLQLALDLPKIYVDGAQMEHAIEILVRNALSQMAPGTTLAISTSQEQETLKMDIEYPVQQLSPSEVERFFYPFTWAKPSYEITDLPMAKILVDKLGGAIDVRLDDTGLLTIEISLPL
jgi:signal transduction histidine kinase